MIVSPGNKCLLAFVVFGCTISLCAQSKPASKRSSKASLPQLSTHYAPGVQAGGGASPLVPIRFVLPGEPLEAHEDSRAFTVGLDGKPVVRETHTIVARDFDGRLYLETLPWPLPPRNGVSSAPHSFTILDPVTRTRMWWTQASLPGGSNLPPGVPGSRTVLKETWNPIALPLGKILRQDLCEGPHPAVRTFPRRHVTQRIKDLGKRMIDGVGAQGCLVTELLPGDPARKIPPDTVTNETWASPLLHIVLLSRHHDPRGHTYVVSQLDDLVLGSPDPNLFEPPPDYKIFDLAVQRRKEEAAEIPLTPGGPRPDEFAGVWEAEDPVVGHGVVIGFSLQIDTREKVELRFQRRYWQVVSSSPTKVFSMSLRVYERDAGTLRAGWFDPNHDHSSTWDGRRLIVKDTGEVRGFAPGLVKPLHPLDLDLSFDPRGPAWVGTCTRNGETRPIRFMRPGASGIGASNPFVGAWTKSPPVKECFQIAEGSDGTFLAWENQPPTKAITTPPGRGASRRGPVDGMIMQNDGTPLNVTIDGDSIRLTDVSRGLVAGRPFDFVGTLSADGTEIVGKPQTHASASGFQPPPVPVYRKLASGTCVGFGR